MRELSTSELIQADKEINVYGYTKIKQMMNAEEVKKAKDLTSFHHAIYEQKIYSGVPDRDVTDKILYNLPLKDKWFLSLLTQKDVKHLLMSRMNDPYYRFMAQDLPNYYLSYFNARSSGDELKLHIDSHIPSPGAKTWSMQVAYILDPSNVENGCTKVIPGSHRIDSYTDRELDKAEPICAEPGDVVLWDSRLWHGTYPNTVKRDRWSLIATLVMWWVKPSMDFTRSISPDVYRELTNEERALLGFCCIPPKDEHARINTKSGYDILANPDLLF